MTRTDHDYRYHKKWRHERNQGLRRYVDAEPVRAHVQVLIDAGMSKRSIAGEAGIAAAVISDISRGRRTYVQRRIANAILAVQPCIATRTIEPDAHPFIPRQGSQRRIQALLALGWRHADLHDRSGVRTNLILSQSGRWVTRATHDAIAAVYTDLSSTPGPSAKTRAYAAARGYLTPAWWDDIDLDDDPDTSTASRLRDTGYLDEAAIERRAAGDKTVRVTLAERDEVVRRLTAAGSTLADIERRTGINPHRVTTAADQTGDTAA